jgi:hypothetical protein
MSFQTLKRFAPFLALLILTVPAAMAASPSARTGARAVYDPLVESVVMFGGQASLDGATARAYELAETWEFDGTRWIRRFTDTTPPARASHVMVYDSNRDQVVIFGGIANGELLNDTWAYRGDWFNREWVKIDTPNSPGVRQFAAAAFDPVRDRMILFGGQRLNEDRTLLVDLYDMWEFDGTTWTRIIENGPQIRKPLLAWDDARGQLVLLGHDTDVRTKMYTYDAGATAWNQATPEKLPPCINESAITYDYDKQLVLVAGGVCVPPSNPAESSKTTDELWAWDGTNWTQVVDDRIILRTTNSAFAWDGKWKSLVIFGGNLAYTAAPQNDTMMYRDDNWISPPSDITSPAPRSLFAMASDSVNNVIWLIGGISDSATFSDLWKFEDGFWHHVPSEGMPVCSSPLASFDTDRGKLVLVCSDSSTSEWDGTTWKTFTDLRTRPEERRLSHMVYDKQLKKTVLYGGYNILGNYINKTWTWNGTEWTEVKANKRPHLRALGSMWYDPILRKTVLFGGIGRKDNEGRLERFNDMWSFDGSTWTEIKPATLPTTRYGAQIAVDPNSNRAILFGGLGLETDGALQKQVYADDTWEWNGTTWTKLATEGTAFARENAGMAWDYERNAFILFGGWSGYYLSDTWEFRNNRWSVFAE